MKKPPVRMAPPSMRCLVDRILDEPELVRAVRALPPGVLSRLIGEVGLEDAGELLALASIEQIVSVLDEDLWHSDEPGRDETFDAQRFSIWLEILQEVGAPFAAEQLAGWPEELVTLALYEHLLVIDVDAWALSLDGGGDELDAVERALDSCLCHEFAEHMLISRRHDGFDALVDVLAALDETDPGLFGRLMDRLCALSSESVDDHGGLAETLNAQEMLHEDAAGDRDERRAAAGYLAPSSALAFLRLIRETPLQTLIAEEDPDPISKRYFRRFAAPPGTNQQEPSAGALAAEGGLLALLLRAGALDAAPAKALPAAPRSLFRRALLALESADTAAGERLARELAFLANALVAGLAREGRRLRPAEAAEEVVRWCERGLNHLLTRATDTPGPALVQATTLLQTAGAVKLFKVGFRLGLLGPDRT